jgi:exodeoxyribonuclease V beta subunit
VLIGDPKQAIYGFRGADVQAYLAATDAADDRRSLTTNHRSDAPLLEATDRLLSGTVFGDDAIRFRAVEATDAHARVGDPRPDDPSPLQLRVVGDTPNGTGASAVQEHVAKDVAATIVGMLPTPDGAPRPTLGADRRPLACGDIAVLVRSNVQATAVQQALRDVGVPSVVNGVGSVLRTTAGTDWRTLLEALERPSDPPGSDGSRSPPGSGGGPTTSPAPTTTGGTTCTRRSAAGRRCCGTTASPRSNGSSPRTRACVPRLLATVGGERQLTDLHHVAELLHGAELGEERGPSALLSWLRARRDEAIDDLTPTEEQARRLESDAEAVQILTIHRSKGLQYRVVLCPFLWGGGAGVRLPLTVHDPTERLPPGRPRSPRPRRVRRQPRARPPEDIGEALRLLYVAVTRAQHRLVLWWARIGGTERSPLARVLFGRDADGEVSLDDKVALPDPDEVPTACGAGSAPARRIDRGADHAGGPPLVTPAVDGPSSSVRRFERRPRPGVAPHLLQRPHRIGSPPEVADPGRRRSRRAASRSSRKPRRGPEGRRARSPTATTAADGDRAPGDDDLALAGGCGPTSSRSATCGAAPGSARSCTPCSSTPTSRGPAGGALGVQVDRHAARSGSRSTVRCSSTASRRPSAPRSVPSPAPSTVRRRRAPAGSPTSRAAPRPARRARLRAAARRR